MNYMVRTLLLGSAVALMSRAADFNTGVPPSCSTISHRQNRDICNITKSYEEFCFSGRCTYTVPPEFLTHLRPVMTETCEATWYNLDKLALADPVQPTKLHYPAINVTIEHLITERHVDGVSIEIRCNNHEYQAVYRATNNVAVSLTESDLMDHNTLPVWGVVLIVLCLVTLILGGIFYCKRTVILGWISCRRGDKRTGVELEHVAQALKSDMDQNEDLNIDLLEAVQKYNKDVDNSSPPPS
ncbi:uncharacterized protein LOC108413130 isoform X2 [Pygocentrus nattereri]|uniref:uncharacterized protein LOC108413130 isoform X2 n=1 Tax=Pygocentrus nattereri TaxID=42514 RepID=UPI00081452EC|nr:uncharacterized protein LOC108413130 isoform X2 [Pygocentrus nattereri]